MNSQRDKGPRRVGICLDVEWRIRRELDVYAGCQSYGSKAGWLCMIEPAIARVLSESSGGAAYDGIVGRITPEIAEAARNAGVPVVNTWLNSKVKDAPAVHQDWRESGVMAARHLLGRGFRRFAYIGCEAWMETELQLQGFRSVIGAEGYKCNTFFHQLGYADWNSPGWRPFVDELHRLLDQQKTPFGILASDDLPCRFLVDVCRVKGLHVPGDVAMVGTGNETVICRAPEPSLTSIELGHFQKGYRAAELLDRLMNGEEPPHVPELLPPIELVLRQSTDAFAVNDALVVRAWRFLAENSDRKLPVDEVARVVAVSRRTLELRFRAEVGRSIGDEMIRLRVNRAMRRLVEMDEPIKVVALATGFSSANYFSKVFTSVAGVSPTRFREERRALSPTGGA